MCPICIATAAWLYAGAGSAGGLTALLVNNHRSKRHPKTDSRSTAGNKLSVFASANVSPRKPARHVLTEATGRRTE
jgi:hypothetical protein